MAGRRGWCRADPYPLFVNEAGYDYFLKPIVETYLKSFRKRRFQRTSMFKTIRGISMSGFDRWR